MHSLPVSLGRKLTQQVPQERLDFHKWVARQLKRSGRLELRDPRGTKYLNFADIQNDAARIRDLLLREALPTGRTVVVIDLLLNSYDLLREPLLLYLGETAVELVGDHATSVVILLPGRAPGATSLLWDAWSDPDEPPEGPIVVIDQEGSVQTFGPGIRIAESFSRDYRRKASRLGFSVAEQLEGKLLRRLGHFDLGPRADGTAECSRYFFHADGCVTELAALLEAQLEPLMREDRGEPWGLVSCAPEESWMHEVCMLIADRHNLPYLTWPDVAVRKAPSKVAGRRLAFLFDVVRTGETARSILSTAMKWSNATVVLAFAAVGPRQTLKGLPPNMRFRIAERVSLHRASRPACDQCQLDLDFTPRDLAFDPHFQLRAYDMWEMLLDVDWTKEQYGPADAALLSETPDFDQVFDKYGSFVAFKYEELLRHLQGNEVVVVCPDEPAVQTLVSRLKVRFEERLVSVDIPRAVLNEVSKRKDSLNDLVALDVNEPWARQLRHLREHDERVVIIDEFNGSGSTAKSVVRLLEAAHVTVEVYVPVLDRKPDIDLGRVKTHPLYEIPSPR